MSVDTHGPARWTPKEVARGVDRYRRYLAVFGLNEDSCAGQAVCHIGCGPFGGVLSVLRGVKTAYPVEADALEFAQHGISRVSLMPIERHTGKSCVPTGACDAVFCLGATGDRPQWPSLEREVRRVCKVGGQVYLWWRLSDDPRFAYWKPAYWKRKPGRILRRWRRTGGLTADRMRRVFRPQHWAWSESQSGVDVPNLYPAIAARWAVLTRLEDSA